MLQQGVVMTSFQSHAPGTFCWIELGTSDAAGAKKFYTDLFGWTTAEHSMGEMGTYYIFQKNGQDAAAMYQMGTDMAGIPPNWMSYVAVSSADDAVEKAKSLGGTVVNGPFDVYDMGRMAVMVDPQGAHVSVWQAGSHIGVQIRDETNTLCWNELQARDLGAAKKFYSALFGWGMKESPEYTELSVAGNAVGGMMTSQAPEGVPSYWLPYFAVDDCDGAVKKAQAGGGNVIVPPMDIEKVGRFAVIIDPQGATFAVIKLTM
jgi:hypothetical protein